MPAPTAREVVNLRWKVRVGLRLVALALLLIAVSWVPMRYHDYRYARVLYSAGMAQPVRLFQPLYFGIPAALAGSAIACLLLGQLGLRLLVPVPRSWCPKCGYDLSEPVGDRCPECGLRIGDSRANDSA